MIDRDQVMRLLRKGLSSAQVGEKLHVHPGTVRKISVEIRGSTGPKNGKTPQKIDHELFLRMVTLDYSADQMAIALDRSRHAVVFHADAHEIPLSGYIPAAKANAIRQRTFAGDSLNVLGKALRLDPKIIQARCIIRGWEYSPEDCPDVSYLYAWRAGAVAAVGTNLPAPPTPGLLHLAAFDPVIERALLKRLRLRGETPSHYGYEPHANPDAPLDN